MNITVRCDNNYYSMNCTSADGTVQLQDIYMDESSSHAQGMYFLSLLLLLIFFCFVKIVIVFDYLGNSKTTNVVTVNVS